MEVLGGLVMEVGRRMMGRGNSGVGILHVGARPVHTEFFRCWHHKSR